MKQRENKSQVLRCGQMSDGRSLYPGSSLENNLRMTKIADEPENGKQTDRVDGCMGYRVDSSDSEGTKKNNGVKMKKKKKTYRFGSA